MTDLPIGRSLDRPIDGVLVIDKPAGPTSHDVVAFVRRALREKRIGHTGTLDPLATGVLPLVVGKATRLASLLSSTDKEYEAAIRLGTTSDTYDAAGQLSSVQPSSDIGRVEVERALGAFVGTFDQMPPPFSAKKVAGVPAYKLARKQKPTALTAVSVTVYALDLVGVDKGLVRLRVRTSPGFYVRSLAHDLGARIGCGAYLEGLRRTCAGGFGLDRAVTLEALATAPDVATAKIVRLDELVTELPAVRVTPAGARRTAHGNVLSPGDLAESGPLLPFGEVRSKLGTGPLPRVRVIDAEGRLLAIADAGPDGVLRPSIVLV